VDDSELHLNTLFFNDTNGEPLIWDADNDPIPIPRNLEEIRLEDEFRLEDERRRETQAVLVEESQLEDERRRETQAVFVEESQLGVEDRRETQAVLVEESQLGDEITSIKISGKTKRTGSTLNVLERNAVIYIRQKKTVEIKAWFKEGGEFDQYDSACWVGKNHSMNKVGSVCILTSKMEYKVEIGLRKSGSWKTIPFRLWNVELKSTPTILVDGSQKLLEFCVVFPTSRKKMGIKTLKNVFRVTFDFITTPSDGTPGRHTKFFFVYMIDTKTRKRYEVKKRVVRSIKIKKRFRKTFSAVTKNYGGEKEVRTEKLVWNQPFYKQVL
jgi:hypothetical protein